jgi:hypothetical protein
MTKKNKKFKFFPLFLFFSSLILIVAGLMASIEESFNMHLPHIAFGFGLLLISLSWLKEGIVALKIASVAATTIAILLAAFLWGWTYIKILVVFLVCLSIILVISIFIKRSKQKIKRK